MTTDTNPSPKPDVSPTWSEQTNKIREFMQALGQPVRTNPFDEAAREEHVLRARLILEEALEFAEAAGLVVRSAKSGDVLKQIEDLKVQPNPDFRVKYDPVEAEDALTDLDYVVKGARVQLGLPESDAFDEVHDSNMSKLGADGKPIHDDFGKILKGPNYFKPNLFKVIEKYRPRG